MDRDSASGGTPYTSFHNPPHSHHAAGVSQQSSVASSPSPGGPIPFASSRTASTNSRSHLSQAYAQAQLAASRSQSQQSSRPSLHTRPSLGNADNGQAVEENSYYHDQVRNQANAHASYPEDAARASATIPVGHQSSSSSSSHQAANRSQHSQSAHSHGAAPYQSIDDDGENGSNHRGGGYGGDPPHRAAPKSIASSDHPPLLEIPEEVYSVRKAALQVFRPLTKTWLIVSVGFALTVLFGTARWTRLLINLPFWFILLPSWVSHVGLLWCHIMSAKALSLFITEANDSRQRPDSRDHLDRTEYLPLLQRSLKFGLKTGLVSFGVFIFEILVYLRLVHGTVSFTVILTPLWILVTGSILDGIICKTQHFLRVICWMLMFASMVLVVLKTDYEYDTIRWRYIVGPIVGVLVICSVCLIYIVYGHQIGYYRLTESQLTAGNLYSLAALISIVLVVFVGEVIPLSRPVEIETRVFVVVMAPLAVVLVGMGAWVVSRDEYGRLLIYGGQAAVHPRRLRWESDGWTSVQGRGVTNIPMFGEVKFKPLESQPPSGLDHCMCCCRCYPYEECSDDVANDDPIGSHPYLAPTPPVTPSPLTYTSPPSRGV